MSNKVALKELGTVVLPSCVRAMLFVPGTSGGVAAPLADEPLKSDLVWVGTDNKKLILYRTGTVLTRVLSSLDSTQSKRVCWKYGMLVCWNILEKKWNIFGKHWNFSWKTLEYSWKTLEYPLKNVGIFLKKINKVWLSYDNSAWKKPWSAQMFFCCC